MGLANSKEVYGQKVDEACCTRERQRCLAITAGKERIRAYPIRTNIRTGCPCGAEGVCKQKVTPKGVIIHYPQKKKIFFSFMEKKYKPPKTTGFLSNKDRGLNNKVKIVKKRTFPPWKLDTKVTYNTKTLPNNTNGCKRRLFSKKQLQPEKPETKSEIKPPLRNDSKFSKFVRKDAIKKPTDKPVKKETEKQSKKESDEKSKSKKESNKKEAKEKRESKPNEESFTIEDPPEKMQLKKDTNEKDSTKKSSNKKEFIRRIRKECHRKENEKIPPSEIGDANNQQKLANEAEPHRNEAGES